VAPHPRRLQVAPSGIAAPSGSLSSVRSGAGAGLFGGCGAAVGASDGFESWIATGLGGGGMSSSLVSGLGSGAGVSSTTLCLPVVQGGMARNSSNVRT
jgi:hypothetical protein